MSYQQQNQSIVAWESIQKALTIDPNCVRASLLEGQLALDHHNQTHAIRAFKWVEQQDPSYLTEIIEPLKQCYQQIGQLSELFNIYIPLWNDMVE